MNGVHVQSRLTIFFQTFLSIFYLLNVSSRNHKINLFFIIEKPFSKYTTALLHAASLFPEMMRNADKSHYTNEKTEFYRTMRNGRVRGKKAHSTNAQYTDYRNELVRQDSAYFAHGPRRMRHFCVCVCVHYI